jgi:hypothetical protein
MKSKEAKATRRVLCPEDHDEEVEAKIADFFSPESRRKRQFDYDNDRRGAIEAQRRKKRERLHEDTEEE